MLSFPHFTLIEHSEQSQLIQQLPVQSQCIVSLQPTLDINQMFNSETAKAGKNIFTLQVRQNYFVQSQIIVENAMPNNFSKKKIIAVLDIKQIQKFEVKRELKKVPFAIYLQQQNNENLSKPLGFVLFIINTSQQLTLMAESKPEIIEKFALDVERKFVVQVNIHNIFCPIRKIAKGASSTVMQGKDKRNVTLVAVKSLKKSRGYSLHKGSLKKQVDILKQLKHPGIIDLRAIYESQKSIYLIFEKFQQNLFQFLFNKGISHEKDLKTVMKSLLQTLKFLHSKNIMHRDIKPQNIMIKQQHKSQKNSTLQIVPILIDFGFAEFCDEQTYVIKNCGTPGYIAPQIFQSISYEEQNTEKNNLQKYKYTQKCDIYSLGCVFHLLLTKRHLFQGSSRTQIIRNNRKAQLETKNSIYRTLDVSARELLFKMLERDPSKRISAQQALKSKFFKYQMFNFQPIHLGSPLIDSEQKNQGKKSDIKK